MKTAKTLILALALCSICWGSALAQVRFDATGGSVFFDSDRTISTSADNGFTSWPLLTHYNVNGFNVTGVNVGTMAFQTGIQSSGDLVAGTANYAPGGSVVIRAADPFGVPAPPFVGTFSATQVWRIRADSSYRLQGTVLGTFDGVNFYTVHLTVTTQAPPASYVGNGQMGVTKAVIQ